MTSSSPGRPGLLAGWGWLGPWFGLAALSLWTASPQPAELAIASVAVALASVYGSRGRGPLWALGTSLLVVAILVGFVAHRQVGEVLTDWDGYWEERVTEVEADLSEELNRRQAGGEAAADALAALWEASRGGIDVDDVAAIRARSQASALALYDSAGTLRVWDGVHRGRVPEDVQRGEQRYSYRDLPLFGYLYVASVADDGSVGVAAFLLRAALPEGLGADVRNLSEAFFDETGERIRITEEDPGITEVVWDLALGEDRLLSVVLERPEQAERAQTMMSRWTARVGALIVGAWLLLALGGPPTRVGAAAAVGGILALASGIPLERWDVLSNLFDPGFYLLPGPVPLTLGRFALLAIAGFALLAVLPRPRWRVPPWVGGVLAGLCFPPLHAWVASGAGTTALAGSRFEWVVYELALAAVLALVAGIAIAATREGSGAPLVAAGSVVVALLLCAGLAAWVALTAEHPFWWTALWAAPITLAAWGVRGWADWRRVSMSWGLAIVLGGSAAIPGAWSDRLDARFAQARQTLETLGAASNPELEEALLSFGRLADSLDAAGAADVNILYDGWRLSGLAELGHPVWLQVHMRDGSPGEGLRVGVEGGEPSALGPALTDGWARGGVQLSRLDAADARYVLTAALQDDDLVSAVAPPFPASSGRSAIGPLLGGVINDGVDLLTVLPLLPGDPRHAEEPTPVRTPAGWRVEMGLDFADSRPYHAHYGVELPTVPLAIARASLMLVTNLVLFAALWLIGRGLLRAGARPGVRISGLVISFRARVTLALFGFFALANALFGTVAYRTLSQASHRSAQVIAERVVEDAGGWYLALGGEMDRIARQVGSELFEYRDGELREGSVEELVELGLYEAWTPYELYQTLQDREIERVFTETSVGSWEYVMAFRRLADGDILGAQVPLQEGTSALQTTDLVEFLGFLILLGGGLSLGLAMMAGRALTRPIHALQVASESVGAGDLALRLPSNRTDEFGAVFRAFNRMVGRVRRARRQLVRTSRQTQLIMDEAAVGMVALDAEGRVTLVNPRAEELLGTPVSVGRRLPADGELGEALAPWLSTYLEGRADEAASDFQVGERRVRVRARRLGPFGTRRGVVVAMDDVTDELRAERVLAWGEMARQVAHEVKNPLTPIKLSIQHVRRAWDDERPDFEDILIRNADAMLSEIDRLAGIAQSFSRFGAPGGDQTVPLEGVSLADVVSEVMALYGGVPGRARFEQNVEEGLPRVVARTAELKEVLVNLLENARMASQDDTLVSIEATRAADGGVTLSVIDDGDGIPEENLPRIFEPQFSTRSTGTGLGLAIVQRVVRAWGGSVRVESEVGEGTRVLVSMRTWPADADREAG